MAVPIVILMGLAAADFGRVAFYDQIVSNAARTAAENGATHSFTDYSQAEWEHEVRTALLNELGGIPHFDQSQLTYGLSTATDSLGLHTIEIEVRYPFRTAIPWPGLPREVPLYHQFVIRQFR
jgi:hypothetical protein